MKSWIVAMMLIALSGCVDEPFTPQATGFPLLLTYNPQLQVIIVQGVESGHDWGNVTVKMSGAKDCAVELPAMGPITTLDTGKVRGATNAECHIDLYYDGLLAWKRTVGLKANPERSAKTWTNDTNKTMTADNKTATGEPL